MSKFKPPTRDDLHAYRVLINFLQQVRTHLEEINGETERSIQLLGEQKAILEEQDCTIQDLFSNLNDYAEDAEHRLGLLKDKQEVLALTMKVTSEYLNALAAHEDSQREEAKFEQPAAEANNG